jgi:hypothetical protein
MIKVRRDPALDAMLDLDGVVSALGDSPAPYWVKFVAKRVPATPERPHGLSYSLTLHDPEGRRVLGFDNAHAVREGSGPGVRTRIAYDHQHRGHRVRFYEYQDAGTLMIDFWAEVESVLTGKG